MHKFLYDMAENEGAIAEWAFNRLRSEITHGVVNNDDAILALLRGSIHTVPDGTPAAFPELRKAGVEFGWQYAQLTRAQLVAIYDNQSYAVRSAIAQTYGLLVDTVFTEEQMREIRERPANLFAVEGMQVKLDMQIMSDDATALLDRHHVSPRTRDAINSVLAGSGMPTTIAGLLTNWAAVVYVLNSPERGTFVTQRVVDDLKAHGTVVARLERMLTELGLWAPLVWTEAERALRHTMEYDRVRLIALQVQD